MVLIAAANRRRLKNYVQSMIKSEKISGSLEQRRIYPGIMRVKKLILGRKSTSKEERLAYSEKTSQSPKKKRFYSWVL